MQCVSDPSLVRPVREPPRRGPDTGGEQQAHGNSHDRGTHQRMSDPLLELASDGDVLETVDDIRHHGTDPEREDIEAVGPDPPERSDQALMGGEAERHVR